jgi:hypothetical protein
MGVEVSTLHPVTAAICTNCKALHFLGCRTHHQILSQTYGSDNIQTRCAGARCSTNTATSKYSCVNCKLSNWYLLRVSISSRVVSKVVSAFKTATQSNSRATRPYSLLICTKCSGVGFPSDNNELCITTNGIVSKSNGQALDPSEWPKQVVHASESCPGKTTSYLIKVDVTLLRAELDYLKTHIANTPHGAWGAFTYSHLASRPASYSFYSYSGSSTSTPPQSSMYPSTSPTVDNRSGLIFTAQFDRQKFHPIAIGICQSCRALNFPGCTNHQQLLTAADDTLSFPTSPQTTSPPLHAACAGGRSGTCGISTRTSKYSCADCRGSQLKWYRVVLCEGEIDYLRRTFASHFRGSADQAVSASDRLPRHVLLICRTCLSLSFPGSNRQLCSLNNTNMLTVDNGPAQLASWFPTHPHVDGCPAQRKDNNSSSGSNIIRSYTLADVDQYFLMEVKLFGGEINYLLKTIKHTPTGHWFMRSSANHAGQWQASSAAQLAPSCLPPPPSSSSFAMAASSSSSSSSLWDESAAYNSQMMTTSAATSAVQPPPSSMSSSSGAYPAYMPYYSVPTPTSTSTNFYPSPPGGVAYTPTLTPSATATLNSSAGAPFPYPYAYPPAGSSSGTYPTTTATATATATAATTPYPSNTMPMMGSSYPYPYPQDPSQLSPFAELPVTPSYTLPMMNPEIGASGGGSMTQPTASLNTTSLPKPPPVPAVATASATATAPPSGPEDEELCVICLSEKREMLFYKCGHRAACTACAQVLFQQRRPCPICRQPIVDVVKIFNA